MRIVMKYTACPRCGEDRLPASDHDGGFIEEDIEYSMAAHCLRCKWTGPEPLVAGGQGRDASEVSFAGTVACVCFLILCALFVAAAARGHLFR